MLKRILSLAGFWAFAAVAGTVEIKVDLVLDNVDYVSGERVRAVVDVANSSPDSIVVGRANSKDLLFVEVFHAKDRVQLERTGKGPFVSEFRVDANEGQRLETFLGDHYPLRQTGKYLARPVLVHGGERFEGQLRAFSIVPGMKVNSALQMFKNRPGLRREFELRTWSRKNVEHLFFAAFDEGGENRKWRTFDLGPVMRLNRPVVSVLPSGEVIVLQRSDRDHFLRSEFWSLPDVLEFQKHDIVQDPETAGTERIRELYKESGGVKAKERPWWKLW